MLGCLPVSLRTGALLGRVGPPLRGAGFIFVYAAGSTTTYNIEVQVSGTRLLTRSAARAEGAKRGPRQATSAAVRGAWLSCVWYAVPVVDMSPTALLACNSAACGAGFKMQVSPSSSDREAASRTYAI